MYANNLNRLSLGELGEIVSVRLHRVCTLVMISVWRNKINQFILLTLQDNNILQDNSQHLV
jgi:hypothetical protein